jgi:hypothetical protein
MCIRNFMEFSYCIKCLSHPCSMVHVVFLIWRVAANVLSNWDDGDQQTICCISHVVAQSYSYTCELL